MNIKNKIATLCIVLCCIVASYGQEKPGREKIKALKVAFITERLSLNSTEAQQFWPIYNAHEEAMNKLRRKERSEIGGKLRDFENLSESEANRLLTVKLELAGEKHRAHSDLIDDLKQVLSAKKIFILLRSEEDFKRRLLRQYRKK